MLDVIRAGTHKPSMIRGDGSIGLSCAGKLMARGHDTLALQQRRAIHSECPEARHIHAAERCGPVPAVPPVEPDPPTPAAGAPAVDPPAPPPPPPPPHAPPSHPLP